MHHLLMSLILFGFLPQPHIGTGSIDVHVVDSLTSMPIPQAIISVSRLEIIRGKSTAIEVRQQSTDHRGIATFDSLPQDKYLILAVIEKGDVAHTHAGTAAHVRVQPDSISTILIRINPASGISFFPEHESPDYRMNVLVPDTAKEERMPIFNPQRKGILRDTSKK